MKRIFLLAVLTLGLSLLTSMAFAQCYTIQSGEILAANGDPVQTGYDKYGYNYQAHIFNGFADNYSRPTTPVTEGLENLVMKWSDEWLSNLDCNNDGKLDRGLDRKTGVSDNISKGWCTNHYEGDYLGADGEYHHYTYFVKIVWVGPASSPDPWDGKRIWGQYAIIEEVYNDPDGGYHGVDRSRLVNPAGLGFWTN